MRYLMMVGLIVGALAGVARNSSAVQLGATVPDDEALQKRIAAEFKANSMLAPRDIDVDVNEGVATLSGKVGTTAEKAAAERLAADVRGIRRVKNEIEISANVDQSKIDAAGDKTKAGLDKAVDATTTAAKKTKEGVEKGVGKSEEGVGKAADKTADAFHKVGDKTSDASISTLVKSGLSGDKILDRSAIKVDTTDRVVSLKGTVPSAAAKARAGEIARGIDGVARVQNELVIAAHD